MSNKDYKEIYIKLYKIDLFNTHHNFKNDSVIEDFNRDSYIIIKLLNNCAYSHILIRYLDENYTDLEDKKFIKNLLQTKDFANFIIAVEFIYSKYIKDG